MNEKAVLVTGANGFLGKTILAQLQRDGFTVYATDMGSTSAAADIAYQQADISWPKE